MNKESGSRVKLGLFITTGLLLFIIAIYLLGSKKNLFTTNFKVGAYFKTASGLQVGSNVRFSGIVVGTVDNIRIINDTTIRIDLLLKEEIHQFIRINSKASIGSDGLMGYKLVNIYPGTSDAPIVSNDGFILSTQPLDVDAILKDVKTTTENVKNITTDLADITHSLRSGRGTLGRLIKDSSLAENFEQTARNLERGSAGINEHVEALKENILFRGYYKKKEKERQEALQKKKDAAAGKDTSEPKKRKFLFFFNKKDKAEEND